MKQVPRFIRDREVKDIFGRSAGPISEITPVVHRLEMPRTILFPRRYIIGLKAFSTRYRELAPSIGSAAAFATTDHGQAVMEQSEDSLERELEMYTAYGLIQVAQARRSLNLNAGELESMLHIRTIPMYPIAKQMEVKVDDLQQILEWKHPVQPS